MSDADYSRCFCGEQIYDVEEGIRTCGHLDDEPHYTEEEARDA